jgi:multidrug efflux pump subunit AcrA (membrane-fusion protein)
MNENDREYVEKTSAPGWVTGIAVAGIVLALGSLGWSFGLQSSLKSEQQKLDAANQQNTALSQRLDETNERMRAQAQTLGQSVGLTQKQLEDKSNELIAAQRTAAATTARLQRQQAATAKQVGDVQTDVSSVKTDVGGVKTDVATTQADLAQTKTQLTRVMGDAGVMSGLIATNHDELEELKHRGDRNYYEFTLEKGAPAQNVGTIKVQLKKVDPKHSKYTLAVNSDDKNIEKKDKNLDEPVQFYSGKQPALFEIVVNNISKGQVTGYLSTPKSAPAPIAVP